MLVAYREGLDADRVIANAAALVEGRGDVERVLNAATYVEDHVRTPFDALHLAEADWDAVVASDVAGADVGPTMDLASLAEA